MTLQMVKLAETMKLSGAAASYLPAALKIVADQHFRGVVDMAVRVVRSNTPLRSYLAEICEESADSPSPAGV